MVKSIFSDIVKINKKGNIEKQLADISGGEIVRYAIIDVSDTTYTVSYSYKKVYNRI